MRNEYFQAIKYFENLENEECLFYIEELTKQWIQVETYFLKDKKKMNEVIELYLKKHAANGQLWIFYYQMEQFLNSDLTTLRKILKRGIEYSKEGTDEVVRTLIDLEKI